MKVYLHPTLDKNNAEAGSGVIRVVDAMYKHLPRYGIDLVGAQSEGDLYACHITAQEGDPDVLHLHGMYPTGEKQLGGWAWDINKRIIEDTRVAKAVTVPSYWVAELFARNMGFAPVIVRHGIEPKEWPEASSRSEHKVLWNKNRPDDVCDASPVVELAKLRPNVKFVSTFGQSRHNVELVGTMPFEAMHSLIYDCSIYYASTKETFGIGILEAMAAGHPVIAWKWGAAPDLVQHEHSGILVQPGDHVGAAKALDYCIRNYDRMSRAARKLALSYTWDVPMSLYARVYKTIGKERSGPAVSVVIPCYNYEVYVKQAIGSVKAQTFEDWECIVVNDGSTDGSLEAIRSATKGDKRFKVIDQPNGKVANARNRGAVEAQGEFLCFLDADDYLQPRALELLYAYISKDRTLGIAYGKLMVEYQGSTSLGSWPGEYNALKQQSGSNQVPSFCMVRKSAFFRAGGYRSHTIPAEDAELWTRIALVGFETQKVTDEAVYFYREHKGSATDSIRYTGMEPNWLAWIPSCHGGVDPFASILKPRRQSHPVYNYDKPLVSIITPVGPLHSKNLEDTIESVMAQNDHRWEHIVVDDTGADVGNYGVIPYRRRYPHIRWYTNVRQGNVAAARNIGGVAARGKYLCFLDADDMLHNTYVSETLKAITGHEKSLVYTDWVELPKGQNHTAETWDVKKLLDHALFAVTFLHEKEAFEFIGGFDENIEIWEDWDYTVRLALHGYVGIHLRQALFAYCYDTGNRRQSCIDEATSLIASISQRYKDYALPLAREGPSLRGSNVTVAAEEIPECPVGCTLVQYLPSHEGNRLFAVNDTRKYRFGGGKHQVKPVWNEDIGYFQARSHLFRVI